MEENRFMVITWILNSISKDIAEAFLYTTSARNLWLDLEARFGESNGPLLYHLQKKLKKLWDEQATLDPLPTCSCGAGTKLAEKANFTQLIQFLMGLNDAYDHIQNQILVMDPLPSIGKAYSMILQVEKQREVNAMNLELDKEEAMTLQTIDTRKQNSLRNPIKKRSAAEKKQMYCTYCKKTGHIREQCFELNGYPEWYEDLMKQRKGINKPVINTTFNAHMENGKGNTQGPSQNENNLSELIKAKVRRALHNSEFSQSFSNSMCADNSVNFTGTLLYKDNFESNENWIMDSGASAHMSMNPDLFHNLRQLDTINSVKLSDGNMYKVEKIGDIRISDKLTLKNVLYIPHFKHNLLSVNALCEAGNINVIFTNSQCFVQDLSRTCSKLQATRSSQALDRTESLICCEICPLAKQNRLPFQLNESHSDTIFDLIHIDVWGSYNQYSVTHCTYMLTIVDDCSRATWVYMMDHKSQVQQKLECFLNMVETQFNLKVKRIRSDNGTEFTNKQCQDLLQNRGILHQRTCVYSPQQNGIVERKHQHLLQVARSIMFYAKLPQKFWVESLLTATYLINRMPTPTLKWKSPYEILHNKALDYTHLIIFGYLCFVTNVMPYKRKFEPRAMKCVFLEYAQDMKSEDNSCPLPIIDYGEHDEDTQQLEQEVTPQEDVISLGRSTRTTHRRKPKCFSEAQSHLEWRSAMKQEIDALDVERYKARLVAKGFNQVEGEDYSDYFAPVAKTVTIRTLLGAAAAKGWHLHHLNVRNAFFHGKGYGVTKGIVSRLKKSLYGLKQASRQWNSEFTERIKGLGFKQSKYDYCLFTKATKRLIEEVKRYLDNIFTVKDLGEAQYFLGLELSRSQKDLIQETYRKTAVSGFTRPDICFAKQQLSQYVQEPSEEHWQAAIHLIRYLKGNHSSGLFFSSSNKLKLTAFSDADWATCRRTRRSTTAYCIFMGTAPISWKSKKQTIVARSSTEAEYRSMAATVCEIVWVNNSLKDLQIQVKTPIPFHCDNKAALHITENLVFHERTKHVELDCHVVRDKFKEGLILPTYLVSKDQVADMFTKVLTGNAFSRLYSKVGLITKDAIPACKGAAEV
ncbi:UNVERIFIED_CONTAM: Retrovirus-related Pol polyprotein from transposon TNT 1-94 [Sesamum indicum]